MQGCPSTTSGIDARHEPLAGSTPKLLAAALLTLPNLHALLPGDGSSGEPLGGSLCTFAELLQGAWLLLESGTSSMKQPHQRQQQQQQTQQGGRAALDCFFDAHGALWAISNLSLVAAGSSVVQSTSGTDGQERALTVMRHSPLLAHRPAALCYVVCLRRLARLVATASRSARWRDDIPALVQTMHGEC